MLLFFLLAVLPLAASEPSARDGKLRLSLDRALELARSENAQLAIGRARKARAEAARLRSRQAFSPQLSLDATYLRLDSPLLDDVPVIRPDLPPVLLWRNLGPAEGYVVGAELVQPLINVSAWNARRQASRMLDAAKLQLRRAEDEIALAVVEAYFGARSALRQVAAERLILAAAERGLKQAEAGREQELLPPVDVFSARARVSEMEARVATAEANVVSARAALGELLGIDAELELSDPVPEPTPPDPIEPEKATVLARRRDLQALEKGVDAAAYGVKRARAAYLPEVNLYARYDRIEGSDPLAFDTSGWLVAVNLHWSIFAGFGQAGALGEARATEQEMRARLDAASRRAWAEVQSAHADWTAERSGWRAASQGVRDSEEQLKLTEARYAEGLDDMTALLGAQAAGLAARTREINARYLAVIAAERYRLATAAGKRLDAIP